MARIEEAMQNGRYAVAASRLSALLDPAARFGPGRLPAGRLREGARTAAGGGRGLGPDSVRTRPYGGRAVADRMDLLIEQGRLADAEELDRARGRGPRAEGSALRMLLIPTLVQEGRAAEAERLIESRWRSLDAKGEGASEQAINLARLHMELRWNPRRSEAVRAYLDQVGRLAPGRRPDLAGAGEPGDPRRLATRRRRGGSTPASGAGPMIQPVWRARLDWAMRTNRVADARAALKHLPAESATPAEVHRLSAWLAAACGDVERERRALAALVAEAPEDFEALERLETLGTGRRRTRLAAELRRRRAEIERDQVRYRELYRRNQPARDAEEMARLAERLGHRFEAIVFLTAAIAEEPDRADLREPCHRLEEATVASDGAGRSSFNGSRRGAVGTCRSRVPRRGVVPRLSDASSHPSVGGWIVIPAGGRQGGASGVTDAWRSSGPSSSRALIWASLGLLLRLCRSGASASPGTADRGVRASAVGLLPVPLSQPVTGIESTNATSRERIASSDLLGWAGRRVGHGKPGQRAIAWPRRWRR